MTFRGLRQGLLMVLVFGIGTARAQLPGMPSGMKGVGLPDVSSISAGNAAGVLGYCVKNEYLGGDATSVLDGLTKKQDVKSSEDYAAGQKGQIQTGDGSTFSLDGVQDKMKSKACDLVLKQAKSLL